MIRRIIMLFYNERIFKRCFDWRGKYWYKNIKEIPLYFKLMHHLIKHGYDEYATWETFDWFIDTMTDVLKTYRNGHIGYPVASYDDKEKQDAANIEYDADLDEMIQHLYMMDEMHVIESLQEGMPDGWRPSHISVNEIMERHKDEFFKLFAKHFYSLWD